MTRKITIIAIAFLAFSQLTFAQSEAGAIFLLIAPGSRAEGMGEAQVAAPNDVYASYWNPAGLGNLKHTEIGGMHVKWLPNLADDMYYLFFTGATHISGLGTVGGHITYLNLGEQQETDENGNVLGTFYSYMTAGTISYGTKLTKNTSIGINTKIVYQMLSPHGAIGEKGSGDSWSFGFDFGYLKQNFLFNRIDLGMMISNIGPKVVFIDAAQADPMPTNMKIGFNFRISEDVNNKFSVVADMNKLLVASYPKMDVNGDYYIDLNGDENAYSDSWYKALITSWYDDIIYAGNIDFGNDDLIGGYDLEGEKQGWYDTDLNEFTYGDDVSLYGYDADGFEVGWGEYDADSDNSGIAKKEVGSKNSGSLMNEIDKMIFNIGAEYVYAGIFAVRAGYIYDRAGAISNPTFGFGLNYANFGFDFGYTSGEEGHPLTNTMRISLKYQF